MGLSMSLKDHLKGVRSHSSSVQSNPEQTGLPDYSLEGSQVLNKYPEYCLERERAVELCFEKKSIKTSSKIRMIEQLKACNRNFKNSASQKRSRKCEDPVRFTLETPESSDYQSSTRICKNSACRVILSINYSFCRRCSCCICRRFDENKDPSLWLICESESAPGDSCGLSCHIECALEQEKVGVVKLGQYMQLDGSYCCTSCGKVSGSGVLGCLKKQLGIAKDAWRVHELCYRLFLCYRLLNGTSRFEELHDIITETKTKLETEVGPMNCESVKTAKGIVSRLAIASEVHKLCSNAINKADECLTKILGITPNCTVDSLPAACRFVFEEVTPSSLVIILVDIPTPLFDSVKGYKLWYCKSIDETTSKSPDFIFSREKRRISIKSLQPCTEYTFRITAYTEASDLGHSEAKCFTKSAEIYNKKQTLAVEDISPGFSVGNPSTMLNSARTQKNDRLEGSCCADIELDVVTKCEPRKDKKLPSMIRELDLNVVSMPDLNEDLTPPLESSRDEDNGYTLERDTRPDDDAAFHGIENNGPTRKRASSDSSLINGSPLRLPNRPGSLDGNFEYCVKVIRSLECEGYIKQEFRLKLLTWFSLGSSEQERRVVNTFIRTLVDDPKSLAGQLVDAFGDIISSKRPRNNLTFKFSTAG